MAINVPIVSSFNNTGLIQANTALAKFGVTNQQALKQSAAGFGLLAVGAAKAFASLDAGYDAIIVATGASGAALDKLKDSANNVAREVPNSFEEVGKAVGEVSTRLGLVGAPLEAMSKKFLDLSRITGTDVVTNVANASRVFGDAGVAVEDQAEALDKLFKATQDSGIGFDKLSTTLVQFGAPMRQLGFNLDESIALLSKFELEGVNTEAVMAGMKIGLGKMAKAGEEPIETFRRVTAEIKNAGSAGEANAIALEAFGSRAGPDMAAAIREGRFEIEDLVASLGGAGGALDDAAEATLSANDKFKMLGNQLLVAVGPSVEALERVLSLLVTALTAVPAPVQKVLVGLLALKVAALSTQKAMAAFAVSTTAAGDAAVTSSVKTKALGAAMGVAGVALAAYALNQFTASREAGKFADRLEDLGRASDEAIAGKFVQSMLAGVFATDGFEESIAEVAKTSPGAIARLIEMEEATGGFTAALLAEGVARDDVTRIVAETTKAWEAEQVAVENATRTQEAATDALDESSDSLDANTDATDDVSAAVARLTAAEDAKTSALERAKQATEDLTTAQVGLLGSEISVENATYAFVDAQFALQEQIDNGAVPGTREYDSALTDAKSASLNMAQALADQEIAQREANGETLSAQDKAAVLAGHLGDLADKSIPAIKTALDGYRDKLNEIPRNVTTILTVQQKLAAAAAAIGGAAGNVISQENGGGGIGYGGGGSSGPNRKVSQSAPFSVGGSLTTAGQGGASYTINVTAGMGANGPEIGSAVVSAIKKYERKNGTGWRAA